MRVGICIDGWKLPIFERHLALTGLDYDVHPGVSVDTFTITVETDSPKDLLNMAKQANIEAANKGKP